MILRRHKQFQINKDYNNMHRHCKIVGMFPPREYNFGKAVIIRKELEFCSAIAHIMLSKILNPSF